MSRTPADPLARPDAVGIAVAAGLATWWWATAVANHPTRQYERIRYLSPAFGPAVLPNWRFFAPNPAMHDTALLYRVEDADGDIGEWVEAGAPRPRRWSGVLLDPSSRGEKGVTDAVSTLLVIMESSPMDGVVRSLPYRMLREHVAGRIRADRAGSRPPRGFQFAIVRHGGHDTAEDVQYVMASPFIAFEAGGDEPPN